MTSFHHPTPGLPSPPRASTPGLPDEPLQEPIDEALQEILDEYRVWKKNTPYLYDAIVTHDLDWPSLTCEWLPQSVETKNHTMHKLLLGTHTAAADGDAPEQNQLLLTQVYLPKDSAVYDKEKHFVTDKVTGGGYGGVSATFKTEVAINHPGEVHRARAMPQDSLLLATKSPSPDVLIFHIGRHPSKPVDASVRPECVLKGHTSSGFGLCWNPMRKGQLLSGSDDGNVCLWDVSVDRKTIDATAVYGQGHTGAVNDVQWHTLHPSLCGSAGEDRSLILWDTRVANGVAVQIAAAHVDEATCIDFNVCNTHVFASGGKDGVVKVWDLRCMPRTGVDGRTTGGAIHYAQEHEADGGIMTLNWSPHGQAMLATGGADRKVCVWDFSKIGAAQTDAEAEEGPPELSFVHKGHIEGISDFSWNQNAPGVVATVDEGNVLQVWKERTEWTDPDASTDVVVGGSGAVGTSDGSKKRKAAALGHKTIATGDSMDIDAP